MLTQSEIKYNRLMEKSEELFMQFGYKAVSMDQIAEAAGISKMTIYRYFSSKQDLFLEVLKLIMDKAYKQLEDEISKVDGTLDKINTLFHFNMETSKQYSFAFFQDVMDNQYILDKVMKRKKTAVRSIFEDIIRSGIEKGEVRKLDETFTANILMSLIDGITNNFLNEVTNKEELESFAEKFYDFLKHGLLGGKKSDNG